MNAIQYILGFPWVQPLGWTLIHFLWQGALIGLIASILVRVTRRSSSKIRYLLACGLLALCVVIPVVTFTLLARPPWIFSSEPRILGNAPDQVIEPLSAPVTSSTARTVGTSGANSNSVSHQESRPERDFLVHQPDAFAQSLRFFQVLADESIRWIVPLWLVGVIAMGIRLGMGWLRIQTWRFTSMPLTDAKILDLFARLSAQMGLGQRICLLLSDKITVPMTLGWVKPAILIPAQILTGLSAQELEAVLAHELAHVARYDYLVNLIQSAIEVILFYHPAVWWLSRQIREIREECCDEVTLRLGADRLVYAKALVGLAELQLTSEPALAATGGALLNRISRLLGRPRHETIWGHSHAGWALSLAGAFVATLAILYSAKLMANPDIKIANTKTAPSGQVVDSTGAPVTGAQVLLYYWLNVWGLDNRIVEKVVTDAGGHFAFTQPLTFKTPNGTDRHDHYVIVATHDGFAPAWTQIVGGTPEQKDFKLQLTPPVSQTYEVVDLKGQPVEGATIWLRYAGVQANKAPFFTEALLLPQDLGFCHAVTDASGRVTPCNLPDTQRSLAASKPGFEDEMNCTTPPDGVSRFTLKPDATLEGRVIDPLGLPVEGVTVWLYPKFGWHQFFMAKTGKDGRYHIDKIWSNGNAKDWGKYQVGIRDTRFTAATRDVAFTSGQTITGFDFSAIRGTEIVGKLLDPGTQQPVAGAEVYVDSTSGRQTRVTDLGGQFSCRVVDGTVRVFFGLPPGGTYVVDGRSSGGYNSTIQTRAFGAELPVTLYAPSGLGKLGTVRGTVTDSDGKPVSYGQISAAMVKSDSFQRIMTSGWVGNTWRGVSTNKDGTFTMTLPIGFTFTLTAQNSAGDQSGQSSATFSSSPLDLPSPIILQPTQSADIVLTDLSGTPRPNYSVEVTPRVKGVEMWLEQKTYKTDQQGRLHLDHIDPALTYQIAQEGSRGDAWCIFDPAAQKSPAIPQTLLITDRYILRVLDGKGQAIPVKNLKEFFVWILDHGQRVQWTDSPPKTLEKLGADVTLDRRTIVLGRPGDKIDMLLETETGDLVRASGILPNDGSGILLAKVTEIAEPDYTDDPSIGSVQPDEVAGRVVGPDSKPVAGATVTFNGVFWNGIQVAKGQPKGGWPQPTFTTDADGIFRVSQTKDKWFYYETVFKDGFAPIFLTDIPKGKGFVVKLQNTTRFAGTIGGENPGKVSLLLEKDKDTNRTEMGNRVRNIQYRTETDQNGAYNFPMEAGTYRFKAVSVDGRFAIGEVSAVANQTIAIPAILHPGYPVTFRLTDCQTGKPVPGIEIGIMEQRPDSVYQQKDGSSRTSDEKGEVHWDNLMPGKTQFASQRMSHPFPGQEQPSYTRWWWAASPPGWGHIDYTQQPPTRGQGVQDIFMDVKNNMEPISILLEKGVKITGSVVGPDGGPQKDALIGVVPNDGVSETLTGDSRFTLTTDDRGKFSGYIPAGNGIAYDLCAYYRPETPPSFANAVSEPFASKPGDELTFHLKMPKGGWITGKLLGSDGKPVDGLRVTATNADRMDLAYAKRIAQPDKDGSFQLGPLRPGHYTVQYGQGLGVPLRVTQATSANSREADIADGQKKDVGTLLVTP
jgi:beta-lactamase regulating signal transducer with metallopeptidase domain/5-hydroxyisourate hydrolase-like protein (transthyretin family)